VSVRTLRKLIAAGTIPVVRVSTNRICVDAVDLEHYIDAHRECGSPREKTGAGGTDETLDLG